MRPLNRSVTALVFALSALATAGAPALADPPEGTIRATGAARSVPDSYVVVLKPDVDATAVAHRYGGTVARSFSHAMHGFELHATETAARRLAADPRVQYVQRNGIMHLD